MVYQHRMVPLMILVLCLVALAAVFWALAQRGMSQWPLFTAASGFLLILSGASFFLRSASEVQKRRTTELALGSRREILTGFYYLENEVKLERYGWLAFMVGMVAVTIALTWFFADGA